MGARGGPTLRRVAPWVALLAGAGAWRWLQWSRSVALFNDGPLFLDAAQAVAEGRWADALAQPQHLLYPIAVALAHTLGLGWENAGAAVSIAGGMLAVGCTTWLVRDAFGGAPGWIAGALLAVHSRAVEFSSDVQSDGLYVGLFAAALAFAWRSFSQRSAVLALACGAFAGLAYLTRPEGLGAALVLVVAAGGSLLAGHWRARDAWRVAGAAALAALLVAGPYAIALSSRAGQLAFTQKKSVWTLDGVPQPRAAVAAPSPPVLAPAVPALPRGRVDRGEDGLAVERATSGVERAWAALRMEARTAKSAFRYGPLALLALGLVAARGRPGRRGVFVALVIGIYAVVLYVLTLQSGYVSRRHALPPLTLLFGYAGLGAWVAGGWIAAALRTPRSSAAFAIVLVATVGAAELAGQIAPRRAEERAAVDAARWLRTNAAPAPLVTERRRLAYYAGMPYLAWVPGDDEIVRAYLAWTLAPAAGPGKARYVLLEDPDDVAAALRVAGERLRLLHKAERDGREAWVFESVTPESTAGEGGRGRPQ